MLHKDYAAAKSASFVGAVNNQWFGIGINEDTDRG
jgi:hypothetical protein